MTWMEEARCLGSDPALFFTPGREDAARAVCATCPVVDRCLHLAVSMGDWDGVRGGMTGKDRKRWARSQGLPRHGTVTGYTRDRCRCGRCREAQTVWTADHRRPLQGALA